MLVEELMSTDVVTCDSDDSLRQAAEEMLQKKVGSVIVTEENNPVGIVTETDFIYAGYVTDEPFSEVPIRKVMSAPLVTINPSRPTRRAMERMKKDGVKKLVVTEDMNVVGILTATDVIKHYPEMKSEIHQMERQRGDWAAESDRFDLE